LFVAKRPYKDDIVLCSSQLPPLHLRQFAILSPQLEDLVGSETATPAECTKAIWDYIVQNSLSDPTKPSHFIPGMLSYKLYIVDKRNESRSHFANAQEDCQILATQSLFIYYIKVYLMV